MPEQQTAQGQSGSNQDGNNGASTSGATTTFTPITSQADLDKLVGERVARERAKYADYEDLKVKASTLDEIEEAKKSEIQKATDARTKAEQERDAARAEALRFKVAAAHGISTAPAEDGGPSDAELFLTASDEATLTKQAERLLGRAADRKRKGNVAPKEGTTSTSGNDEMRDFARRLFNRE